MSVFRSIKSKNVNKDHLKEACFTAASGLHTTLQIAREAAGHAGVPGLQEGITGLLFVLDVIKQTSQNVDDIRKFGKQIEELNRVLEKCKSEGTFSPAVIERVDRLFTSSNTSLEELRKIASRSLIKRVVHYKDDARSVSEHIQSITWSIQSFTVETIIAIEFSIDEHAVRIEERVDKLGETIGREFQQVNAKLDKKDGNPPYAVYSPFNCKNRAPCLEGTRTDILDQIFRWIGVKRPPGDLVVNVESGTADSVAPDTCIFWINGSAGTGKTTIAYTVSDVCYQLGILGASFFSSRDDSDCSNPGLIFTSIAYQLGNFNASFKDEVTRAMKSNPDIGYSSIAYQLEELIVKPLRKLGRSFPPCVIVLDALDECKDNGATSIILSTLSRHIKELSPLKFLVTSRPERHITTVFQSNNLGPSTRRYILHEVELSVVENDIECYLSSNLSSTRTLYMLDSEWPSAEDVHSLAQLSSGLFIFASTSVKFIDDPNYDDPKDQLTRLLRDPPILTDNSSPHYTLDQLYAQVLNHAHPHISAKLSGRLKGVLGTIVLLRDPLSSASLERLLGFYASTVRQTLLRLHSVVMVPDNDSQVIRTLHPSFFDFITDPDRCRNPKLVVNPQTQHTLLARSCLDVLKELKRDICGIRNPSILNSEVDDLPMRIMACIPPHLQYACRHWAWHLSNSMFSDVLLDLVREFCSKYLLYWIEAMGLMGDLRNGLLALSAAQRALTRTDGDTADAIRSLYDGERFMREFFSIISTCSLQVYHSALLFTPQEVSIKRIYDREMNLPVKICNPSDKAWSPCIQTIEGHSAWITSVAISHDGTRIVSGSGDRTVCLWDAIGGAHLNALKGHSKEVASVAFSRDDARIVSGSGDCTVRLWDAVSGAHLKTLSRGSHQVTSVAFSHDDARIVSGSFDSTVCLWDAVSGAHLNTLKGHSKEVASVAFSHDGVRVVSGSYDTTVRLWDAVSGALLSTLMGHSFRVTSVAFSLDDTRIVSGSSDSTVRLWDAISGAQLKTLTGHSDWVMSVAFSHDGARIVSGSYDTTVRLWDAISGARLNTLTGHSHRVTSVAFSRDDARIVYGSFDSAVRLWDAVGGAHLNTLEGHSKPVASVAFSHDGARIVSRSDDTTVRLQDAVSGAHLNTLKGHSKEVTSVAFSHDGTRIVSGSSDRTVRLWDAVGAHLNALKGHSNSVRSVAFSHDGTRIVSGSDDRTVRLWDAVSGAHLNALKGHSKLVASVAFSHDGARIVSGSFDCTVRLWDAVSGAHLNTLKGHADYVLSVAFSRDDARIVSGSHDFTARLWDAISGAQLKTLKEHSDRVMSVAFSHDGARIVSGSTNGTVYLWDALSGVLLDTLQANFICVHSIVQSCSSSRSLFSQTFTDMSDSMHPIFGYITDDGPKALATMGDRVAFGTVDGRVIIIDFTGMDSYLRNL